MRDGNWTQDTRSYTIQETDIVSDIQPPETKRLGAWRKCYSFEQDFTSLVMNKK